MHERCVDGLTDLSHSVKVSQLLDVTIVLLYPRIYATHGFKLELIFAKQRGQVQLVFVHVPKHVL